MSFVKVGPLASLPPNSVSEVEIDGQPYAVCNVEGEIYAIDGICPHAGGRLGHGAIHGHFVSCPWHGWEYDCRTGAHDSAGAFCVRTFPVRVEDGCIYIDTGAGTPRS